MKIFAKTLLAAAVAVLSIGAHAAVVIDDFTDPVLGAAAAVDTSFLGGGGNGSGASATTAGSMIGLSRDIFVIEVNNPGGRTDTSDGVKAKVEAGIYSFSSDAGQYGVGIIRWDGAANTGFAQAGGATTAATELANAIGSIAAAGFAATDLLSTSIGFTIEVLSADAGFPFTLQAYSFGNGGFSEVTLVSPGGPGFYFIPFAGFSCVGACIAADFTQITALQAIINFPGTPVVDVDLRIDLASTAVPEPGALALAGLALVGVGMARRFGRKAK